MGNNDAMRVLVAPDKFAGTLSASEAAEAIAVGWRLAAPDDEIITAPLSDGGPGFVDAVQSALGGELSVVSVPGPAQVETDGEQMVPATMLTVGDTVYLESAQAVGLPLAEDSDPLTRTSYGVGVLLAHALQAAPSRIVLGVGGTSTNDGGAGLLAALGAYAENAELDEGPSALAGITAIDLSAPRALFEGIDLVVATDVDSVLAGLFGATKNFGPHKGISEEALPQVDAWLAEYGAVVDRGTATRPGSGAGGGLGFAMMALGARQQSGIELVMALNGLADTVAGVDLVITGEGSFDYSSGAGKVPHGVGHLAAQHVRPCLVLAGRVSVGSREMRALGIDAAYSMVDLVGEEGSLGSPITGLEQLAARVARTWSRE